MVGPLPELVNRWRRARDAASTIALCEALATAPDGDLASEIAGAAMLEHGGDARVLVAAARALVAAERFDGAQAALVAAGKAAPRDPSPFRWLGEVLLRRGDAERAVKVLERAVQLSGGDEPSRAWMALAQQGLALQAERGVAAVAAEIARVCPVVEGRPRPRADSFSDMETAVRPMSAEHAAAVAAAGRDGLAALPASAPAPAAPSKRPLPAPPSAPPPPLRPPTAPAPERSPRPPSLSPQTGAHVLDVRALSSLPSLGSQAAPFASAAASGMDPRPAPPPPVDAIMAPTGPRTPDPRDVLDALALAGIFEPPSMAPAPPPRWDTPAKGSSRRGGTLGLIVGSLVFAAASFGVFGMVQHRRDRQHQEAEAILAQVEADLRSSVPATIEGMDETFSKVFELDSRSPRAAIAWLRARALRGLLKGGEDIAFEGAIARAEEVEVKANQIAFARVASFLLQGDTAGAAALLPKWDGPAADDPWYQLVAGATLERAGDARAAERYGAAARLDPELIAAQIAAVRVATLEGDPARAVDLAADLKRRRPTRIESLALVALAWGRNPMRSEQAPPEADDVVRRSAELPVSLAAVPYAVTALRALSRNADGEAKAAVDKGLTLVSGPGMATWLGTIALDTEDEPLARKGALAAVRFSAAYPPARALAARVALLGEHIDEAQKATEDLDGALPEVAVVRAATAYERTDADALARALDALSPEGRRLPLLAGLLLAPDALAGRGALMARHAVDLARGDAPWADLIAMDLALDTGDLASAATIGQQWSEADKRPSRAVRLSRLARYQDRLDVADTMSAAALSRGVATVRSLSERVAVLVARGRSADVGPLLSRYPAVLGPLATWLSALATASAGKVEDARGKLTLLDVPPGSAPLPSRIVAAEALGAVRDRRRGADLVHDLLAAGIASPDVTKAAEALGAGGRHGR